jgi:8-oxo-dGTP diphosphatase
MDTLLTITDQDIDPASPLVDPASFRHRQAARAVVLNAQNGVALLNVGKRGYHKLPGGGVETGEDMVKALERELLEEIGCQAEIVAEIGEITQQLDQTQLLQVSWCYLARQIGETQEPEFTEKELADGFQVRWTENIQEAISILEADQPTAYEGHQIRLRDLAFLKAASSLI